MFEVDPGFDYLVRFHFCELDRRVTGSLQRVFQVFINNETAGPDIDVWDISGGFGIAVFRDYVVSLYGESNSTKVPLWLALHPNKETPLAEVLLNGIEILKLNQSTGNLAVLNQFSFVDSPSLPIQNQSPDHHTLPIIGGAVGGAVLIFACLVVVFKSKEKYKELHRMKKTCTTSKEWVPSSYASRSRTSTMSPSLPSDLCRRFSLTQIRDATCDFDENLIIGKGGFGMVYKGSLDGGATKVAIKRLTTTSKQGAREFQTEIEMLSRLRHVHLVSLIGYCEDQGEMILVYEYMPRGTLRDHLMYKKSETNSSDDITPLSWKQRLTICVGSARGLHYLHAGAKQLIIHRDVKSTNILLDEKWTAKVSDFGLSKMGPMHNDGGTSHISTAVKGSIGYLDPEYYQRQQLSEKSDVYSFGVVLFEVLCARAVINPNLPKEQVNLSMWARKHYKSGTLHTIVDPNLRGQIAPECLRKFGEIAEMCVCDRGSERPSMGDVVWSLEYALQLQETAEKNLEEISRSNSFHFSGVDGGVAYDEVDDTASRDNFSLSVDVESVTKRLLDSITTTSTSSDYPLDMKSGSVFSEIIDPQAR